MLVYVFALRGPGNPTNPANPYNPWVVGATQGEAVYALRLPPQGLRKVPVRGTGWAFWEAS